jgi:hypothetical protein
MSIRSLCVITLATALSATACTVVDPLYCDEKNECTDPDRPFCDLNGEHPASDGVARTCIPEPEADESDDDAGSDDGDDTTFCAAGEFVQCTDDDTAIYCNDQGSEYVTVKCESACDAEQLGCFCEPETSVCSGDQTVHCGTNGQVEEVESCALGCNDTGERCLDVDPSNGLGGYLDMTDEAPVVVLSNGAVIDTDKGTIEDGDGTLVEVPTFQVGAPEGGVAIRVFAVKSLRIGDATVSGSRGMALVSDGDVFVGGHIRILAGSALEGACVGRSGEQVVEGPNGGDDQAFGGGGGGGFGGPGGAGGNATADVSASGGAGGAGVGDSSLVPLRGGCSGGSIGTQKGGNGGGAAQVVSRSIILLEDGSGEAHLDAGGSGGGGSGGGGSGGGLLLEAPRVVVSSGTSAVANGGGGGAVSCGDAADGSLTDEPSQGGGDVDCVDDGFGPGGNGGTRSASATDGQSISGSGFVFAGAGGGSVGRIRINVPVASDFIGGGIVSPDPSIGSLATR